MHAYEPNGSELKGWPVQTEVQQSALGHAGSPALAALGLPHEPPRGPVIADLAGNGSVDVITAAGTHVYAWHANGKPVAHFPVSSNPAFCAPALENDNSHPKCGFLATPAIAHLEGFTKKPDIVEPSLDGHLYAWKTNGTPVKGFPVALVDPVEAAAGKAMVAESINEPAIGDLTGSGHDDVVVASNEVYGAVSNSGDVSFAGVTSAAAGTSGRLYAIDGASGKLLPGWPVAMPGIIQDTLPFIGPGQDAAIAKIGGQTVIVASVTGGSLEELSPAGAVVRTIQQVGSEAFGAASNATDRSGAINLFESASVGDLLGTGTPDVVKYELSLSQAANLLLVGQNFPYNHLIGAFDGATGVTLPAFPTVTDDYQLLSANNVAKVDPTLPTSQVVGGTGLGLLHAYDGATGKDVRGFPKQTGGWLYAPPALAEDGRMADLTREGYLFEWQTQAPACQPQWPSFRHDQQGSGNYDHDGTPPNAPANVEPDGARRRQIPAGLHRSRRRRLMRHAGVLSHARERQTGVAGARIAGRRRQRVQRRSDAPGRRAHGVDPGGRRGGQPRAEGDGARALKAPTYSNRLGPRGGTDFRSGQVQGDHAGAVAGGGRGLGPLGPDAGGLAGPGDRGDARRRRRRTRRGRTRRGGRRRRSDAGRGAPRGAGRACAGHRHLAGHPRVRRGRRAYCRLGQRADAGAGRRESGRRRGRVVRRGHLARRADLLPRPAGRAGRDPARAAPRRAGRRGRLLDPR